MPIDEKSFRDVMSSFPTGVAVVTAADGDRLRGLTVSAFSPVSLSPPLVLVCIDKTSNTLPAVRNAQGFTVNLLAAGREETARRFASKEEDKFRDLEWRPSDVAGAGPILAEDSVAYVCCTVHSAVEAGDHWIFVGLVEEATRREGVLPLLYREGAFS